MCAAAAAAAAAGNTEQSVTLGDVSIVAAVSTLLWRLRRHCSGTPAAAAAAAV